jgi:hypothetical protein
VSCLDLIRSNNVQSLDTTIRTIITITATIAIVKFVSMDITPDLSHLAAHERQIIEAVMNRHKIEEQLDELTLQ